MKELRTLVLGFVELGGCGWVCLEATDLRQHRLSRGDGRLTLGRSFDTEDSRDDRRAPKAAANAIGKAEFGANVLHDARSEAAGKYLVHYAQRIVVRVAAFGAEADDYDVGLVDVGLLDEVDASTSGQ